MVQVEQVQGTDRTSVGKGFQGMSVHLDSITTRANLMLLDESRA